jgi:hypothetical protein
MVLVFSFVTLWTKREREREREEKQRERERDVVKFQSEYPVKFESFSCFSRLGDK